MHYTEVVLKDGRTFEGPIWTFRPHFGYLTIVREQEERFYFRSMKSCLTSEERVGIRDGLPIIKTQDEIERARETVWRWDRHGRPNPEAKKDGQDLPVPPDWKAPWEREYTGAHCPHCGGALQTPIILTNMTTPSQLVAEASCLNCDAIIVEKYVLSSFTTRQRR